MIGKLETENARLKAQNAQLSKFLHALEENQKQLEQDKRRLELEKRALQQRIDSLLRRIFGKRSERFMDNPDQGILFEELQELAEEAKRELESEFAEDEDEKKKRRRRNGRKPLPKDLPRETVQLDLTEDEKTCPHGHAWEPFGEDRTEELDIIPAQIFVREFVRPKYKNPCCDHPDCQGVKTALLPMRPIEQGRPAPGLLADIAISKYGDHLPLYRQEDIFKRHGVAIPRSTMCGWMMTLGDMLMVVYLQMKQWIVSQGYLQADETKIRVQGMKKGRMHTGYFWGYGVPWADVVYEFALDRSHRRPLIFLEDFEGLLQVDGYDGYNALIRKKNGQVIRLGCWAHVRRGFYEALNHSPHEAKIVLGAIQKLYRIERDIKGLGAVARLTVRQERAQPILEDLKDLLEIYRTEALPQKKLGEAISYALNEWPTLERYVNYGEAEIDNNSIESTLRPIAVGRKNYLFVGSPNGGEAAAVFYSLITTCKRLEINPWEYLKDVIERLPTHPMADVWELTPRGWKEAREGAAVG